MTIEINYREKMDKINEALNKIEAVLKAVNSFQSVTVCGDFEKRYAISWPDVDGGLKAVSTVRDELKNQNESETPQT